MPKDTKKENPLLSKNIPKPPAAPAETAAAPVSKSVPDSQIPQQAVKPQNTAKRGKITFYPEPEHENKLYDLMEAYRKRTGVKINQQDLLKRMLEVVTIDTLLP